VAIVLDLTRRREAERRAREAEHLASIGTLAAGLAHDIGTPMNVILGYADMLERQLEEGRHRERAHIIGEQVKRISHLVHTLLHLARPSDEQQRVPVELAKVVEDSLDFLGEKLRKRAISVSRHLQPTPAVQGDPNQLQQVLVNLFVNAADAMAEGGTLRVGLRSAEDDQVELRVADTGCGIPPQDVERIFEPFFTTKETGQGTGLGLLVTKRIVFDHGGRIDVKSREGEGTEFRIVLPAESPGSRGRSGGPRHPAA
jgi:signal transduction histidine kinase